MGLKLWADRQFRNRIIHDAAIFLKAGVARKVIILPKSFRFAGYKNNKKFAGNKFEIFPISFLMISNLI
jgi:hypothetical protein